MDAAQKALDHAAEHTIEVRAMRPAFELQRYDGSNTASMLMQEHGENACPGMQLHKHWQPMLVIGSDLYVTSSASAQIAQALCEKPMCCSRAMQLIGCRKKGMPSDHYILSLIRTCTLSSKP